MDTTQLAAAVTLLQSAKAIALLPVAADDVDAVASSLALAQVLRAHGTQVRIYPGGQPRVPLTFLAGYDLLELDFAPASELTVHIPTTRTPVDSLTYERTATSLDVHVTARQGSWSTREVEVRSTWQAPADLLVVVGAARLALLGARFTAHAELFYDTPLLNLTYQPEAEHFGRTNVVDRSARSCAEVVSTLLRTWDRALTTPTVATALYAGLMAATESWQKSMTSPAQFELGAALLEQGADRLGVVRHLYKTKPLAHLKLWGQVLARLTTSLGRDGTRTAVATLTTADVATSGANLDAVQELLSTVLVHAPDVDVVGVVVENGPRPEVFVASARGEALTIARTLGAARGSATVARCSVVAGSLEEARQLFYTAASTRSNAGRHFPTTQRPPADPGTAAPRRDTGRTRDAQEAAGRQARPADARR
ncbi:MAG: hypothetical protein U0514_00695 [Candidatus Andersenbacteria bacterium]